MEEKKTEGREKRVREGIKGGGGWRVDIEGETWLRVGGKR